MREFMGKWYEVLAQNRPCPFLSMFIRTFWRPVKYSFRKWFDSTKRKGKRNVEEMLA